MACKDFLAWVLRMGSQSPETSWELWHPSKQRIARNLQGGVCVRSADLAVLGSQRQQCSTRWTVECEQVSWANCEISL